MKIGRFNTGVGIPARFNYLGGTSDDGLARLGDTIQNATANMIRHDNNKEAELKRIQEKQADDQARLDAIAAESEAVFAIAQAQEQFVNQEYDPDNPTVITDNWQTEFNTIVSNHRPLDSRTAKYYNISMSRRSIDSAIGINKINIEAKSRYYAGRVMETGILLSTEVYDNPSSNVDDRLVELELTYSTDEYPNLGKALADIRRDVGIARINGLINYYRPGVPVHVFRSKLDEAEAIFNAEYMQKYGIPANVANRIRSTIVERKLQIEASLLKEALKVQ